MEAIHVKTVDPISQDLLRAVAARGIDLNWERFEKLQPMDGFLRLGLSCPFGCLEGPCRIDPFGRGAAKGICGLDRDGMAAAMLLRLAVNGALEALADSATPTWPEALKTAVAKAEKTLGGAIAADEAHQAAATLARPSLSPAAMVRQAVRLGVLTLGLVPDAWDGSAACKAGFGALADGVIGFCGRPSAEVIKAVAAKAPVVALGDWIMNGDEVLPLACTSGEAELVVAAGLVDAVVRGAGVSAAIAQACEAAGIPAFDDTAPAEAILAGAAKARAAKQCVALPDMPSAEGTMVFSADALAKDAGRGKLAVFAGADMVQQPLGWIATEVAPTLAGDGACIAGWGDAATWMLKAGLGSDAGVGARALCPMGGAKTVMAATAAGAKLAGVCFTGLRGCRDLAVALGMAALGARVCLAAPIPVWGSAVVRDALTAELSACGGELAHFDHVAGADEVLQWFNAK